MNEKKGVKSARWYSRMRRLRRRNDRGVSPIIATILLVAITVVLAAVLYVLVAGLTKSGVSTPYALEMTSTGPISNVGNNWTETIAIAPTPGLTTAMVQLSVLNITGGTWKVGTPAATCFPKTTPVAAQATCNVGVASGWFAYLVYNSNLMAIYAKNGTAIQWNYPSGTAVLPLTSEYITVVFWATTSPSGANKLVASGMGSTTVAGQCQL